MSEANESFMYITDGRYELLKRNKKTPSSQIYFNVQIGILLPNIDWHPKESFENSVRAPSSDNTLDKL